MRNLRKDQIVTIEDLETAKSEILECIKRIGTERNLNSPVHRWLKSAEVRALLGFSPGKLQAVRESGLLKYTKIGGNIYYDPEDLQSLFSNNQFKCRS
ncbi:helix-turn-helix domain-containing protein [Sphingobacterium sp. UBA6645]|uniref:helix-turn-helix domain-containing protein n=1 Tax=Sphingobacterium sp. UBA6645 TaxID=1947511 RepID=UPI0025EA20D1|nr:helix-turn-helix domain-containing protein [Sphingobacterium sp. UBA6645]